MRVFYTEEPNIVTRRYFINIENIVIPDHLKGTKAFDAETTAELKSKIIAYYGFTPNDTIEIQMWSGPHGSSGIRLDLDTTIPEAYDTIWIRAAFTSTNNTPAI
jgi:hypothetical protein